MEEDTEYVKLPVEDRCVHKLWKARVHGYEEAAKLFRSIDDEKSPEFNKYLGLIKKFVIDSNAVAQEKGLEAVLAYVENSAVAGKTVGDVMSGVITKCIAAPKTKTKELAVQITLMYIEIEKADAVQEELLKGMEHKNPKIMSACVSAITQALREFGPKVVNIKPLIKKMPVLLEDRDKGVRDEGKAMVVEIYKWIGDSLKTQLSSLKPVQVTELEAEFEKVKGEKVSPTRYLKSQQQKQAKIAAEAAAGDAEDEPEDEDDGAAEIDPYELLEPVDILSKLPKDFFEKLEAKKWQERKEAVDTLEQLLQNAEKLESGDYGDVVRALKKVISKDTNVMVVAVAGKCLAGLANGLKKRFQPYSGACIPCILEKFREKKQNVVIALRDAIDAIYLSTTIEAIQEDVLAALENKNPQVKAETTSFLARCFTKCTPMMLNKKLLKAYTTALLKTLNESDPTVRDNSAEALGTAMKVVGEKQIMAFMPELDNIKMTKIKECCDKAVIVAKVPKSERPTTAPAKMGRTDAESGGKTAGSTAPKPVKRPVSASSQAGNAAKKATAKKAGGPGSAASGPKAKTATKTAEKDLSSEEVDERASAIFPEDVLSGLGDANWKTRLSAVEQFTQIVSEMEPNDVPTQVLIRTLNKKPGLKDTNFQVLKARLEAVKLMAETTPFSSTALDYCVTDIADKLGDVKNGTLAAETLTSLSEAAKLDLVACEVLNFAFNQKSPKVQQEALSWLTTAIREFGFIVEPKAIMDNVKKAISATHPGVRNAGITFAGTLYVYLGSQLKTFFESEKPALQQQIFAEFDKHVGETPPLPIRGKTKKTDEGCEEEEDETCEAAVNPKLNINNLMPHVDISSHITEALLNELSDRNWKVRNEALQKLATILSDNKLITNNLGELPPALAQRLVDSNSKIAAAALAISETLGTAMGAQCKTHVRTLFPGFLQGMGDSKAWIRTAAASCINVWGEQCGYKEFFDGEMIGDALKSGSPTLRAELWAWLTDKLPTLPPKSIPKDELLICLPHLYSNMEDRNAEVRKNAQEAALPYMLHLGYETMVKAAEKLKPGSRTNILVALDKARANMPAKPLPKKKAATPVNDDDMEQKTVKSGGAKAAAAATKVVGKGKVPPKATGRKKDEDADTSPLLQTNNLKNQRAIDEQKLKVLKWNFTSPREEFVDLLKDQMTTANVNKTLMANMFHSDFKYHLKALESLNEDLPNNPTATVANLDLVLKWMTLRFFDTNPSVILKGLEYLQTVFSLLIEEEYNMFETEASSFVPYLVLKIGDPKDAVRNGVRALLKQIECVYPATKIFAYVMEGLKSKNARQRTECLDQLGSLILNYGVSVCQPNPNAALKEVARQISDRDNSVRNAALNCVVQAYYIEGDRVYKMIGQISDKDLSLLEERIKRAAKNRPAPRAPPAQISKQQQQHQQQSQPQKMVRQGSEGTIRKEMPELEQEEEEESSPPPPVMSTFPVHKEMRARSLSPSAATSKLQEPICSSTSLSTDDLRAVGSTPKQRPVSTGPFGLDFELLERIEGKGLNLCAPKLAEFDLRDIINDTPINIPNVKAGYQTLSPPPALQPVATKVMNVEEKADYMLDSTIANIADPDTSLAIQSILQLESLMQTDKASRLTGKVDQIILACVMQLKLLTASNVIMPNEQLAKCYRSVFMMLITLYNNVNLPKRVSKDVLRDMMDLLISLLVNKHMEELDNGESYVRIVNTLVVKVIEKSDHTNVTCALIKSLHDCVENSPSPRFTELVMKCLWKVVKLLPSWESETDFDMILFDIHLFLKEYPTSVWKKKQSDTPIRTIKTILHCMTKMKGNRILLHLNRIDNIKDSELQSYLVKLIKTVKQESSPAKKESKSHHRLSKTTHELLSEIFKKIGSKDQTKEFEHPSSSSGSHVEDPTWFGQGYLGTCQGLSLLYDFKQQHPEADVDPFLRKASQFFQDYVDRGLQSIEMERKRSAEAGGHPSSLTAASSLSSLGIIDHSPMTPSQGDAPSEINAPNPSLGYASHIRSIKQRVSIDGAEDSDSGSDSKMALYYLERLRALQEQAGHNPSAVLLDSKQQQQLPRGRDDNGTNDENLNRTSVLDNRSEEIHSVQRSSSNSDVDALRRRVEELRGSLR